MSAASAAPCADAASPDVARLLEALVVSDRVIERVAARVAALMPDADGERWMNSADATRYLGLPSVHALHKLTSARRIPFHQDAEGGRLYFQRVALDAWRTRSGDAA